VRFDFILQFLRTLNPNNTKGIAAAFASSGVMFSSLNDQPTGEICNYGGTHFGRSHGSLRIDPTVGGNLPTCTLAIQGMFRPVSDSTANTWCARITLRGHPKAANEGHLKTGQRK
jgi:hypothetical protein